ncbi:uncharacterized protein LOC117585892 [Drosophila guanche]|uniref:Uncharacterized protein n=1 Tax=Drosophila guanche TaxID=7266 RepID=A0A3B0KKG4_DROGU|nr:uncharacterized protein LOC117585892 [Drosophila guanche]SPP84268.1 Hypothetical predicted protein [Drosophila guanche]
MNIENEIVEYNRFGKEPEIKNVATSSRPSLPAADLAENLRRLSGDKDNSIEQVAILRDQEVNEDDEEIDEGGDERDEEEHDEATNEEDGYENNDETDEQGDDENDDGENEEEEEDHYKEEEEEIAELPRHYIDGQRLNPYSFSFRVNMFASQQPLAGMDSPRCVIQRHYPTFYTSFADWYYNRGLLGEEGNVLMENAVRNCYPNTPGENELTDPGFVLWDRMRRAGYLNVPSRPQPSDPLDQLRSRAPLPQYLSAASYPSAGATYNPVGGSGANTMLNPFHGMMSSWFRLTYPIASCNGERHPAVLHPNTAAYPTANHYGDNVSNARGGYPASGPLSISVSGPVLPQSEPSPGVPWRIYDSLPVSSQPEPCRVCEVPIERHSTPSPGSPNESHGSTDLCPRCEYRLAAEAAAEAAAETEAEAADGRDFATLSPSGHIVPRSWLMQVFAIWQHNEHNVHRRMQENTTELPHEMDSLLPRAPRELENGQPHLRGPYTPLLAHRLANAVEYGLFTAADDRPNSLMMSDVLDQIIRLRPNFMDPNTANEENQITHSRVSPLDQRELNIREEQKIFWDATQRRRTNK